jgi:predicted RNA-binding Zn-ribbon protein involved in translation (DUF1610 family)
VIRVVSGQSVVECPFCGKLGVKAFHKPSHLEPKATHISAGSGTTYHRVPESYDIVGGCPNCGKTREQIERAFDTGMTREVPHEQRLRRLREAGLPTRTKSSPRPMER